MEEFQRTLSPCSSLSSYVSSSNPDPLSIDVELWLMAEQRAHEILCTIQPNVVSELRRKEVMNYIQGLINRYFGNEVKIFPSPLFCHFDLCINGRHLVFVFSCYLIISRLVLSMMDPSCSTINMWLG